ncbi:MAG: F0F1 ATP synthase subunit epsilon [FCB group bacterium]|nr:F0F1 ATP synthase subunit epsilon [FCB group bacterium]
MEVVTPDGVIYSNEIVSLKIPGNEGMFGVLANHAPFMTGIRVGSIEADTGSETVTFATSGGFTEVLADKTTVLAETAEISDAIDVERAEAAVIRARERLSGKQPEIDVERAQLTLLRALNRLKVAGMK